MKKPVISKTLLVICLLNIASVQAAQRYRSLSADQGLNRSEKNNMEQ